MSATTPSSFVAVVRAELLFNVRRIAPYVLALLFAANAVFWWALGPAVSRGWATNSDFFIVRLFGGFTFLTLPLFIAVLMGDPVIRDFEIGIDPLIFSKPIRRAEYLLGKFFGNFAVLVACLAAFAVTLLVLQAFGVEGMVVLAPRALPYAKHFFALVVVSALLLSALCFAIGTLTRNVKIVYGVMASFYVVYATYQISIKGLSLRWRILLDPLLFNISSGVERHATADWLNTLVVSYDAGLVANRLVVVLLSAIVLTIVHLRFSIAPAAPPARRGVGRPWRPARTVVASRSGAQHVHTAAGASLRQSLAVIETELRLAFADRSFVIIGPLAVLVSVASLAFYSIAPTMSYSAEYAARSAQSLLVLLCAAGVFFTVEAMFRDRVVGIEPLLWSTPVTNGGLLVGKCAASAGVAFGIGALVGCATVGLQLLRHHGPVAPLDYAAIYIVVLMPSVVVAIALAAALSVVGRDKYLTYALIFGLGGAVYYLQAQGHTAWWYNPTMSGLWTPGDLVGQQSHLGRLLLERLYWLGIGSLLLCVARGAFQRMRKS